MRNTQKTVFTALFAALCCVTTMFIMIPSPIGGYIHPGDAVVLLGAYILGPVLGAASAGIGSAIADVLGGYAFCAPGTLVIKALSAFTAGWFFRILSVKHSAVSTAISGFAGEIVMVAGYLAYFAIILNFGTSAFIEIPGNIIQGIFGVAASTALFAALRKTSALSGITD